MRQIPPIPLHRPQRRELTAEVGMFELEDVLRAAQILQAMHAQITQRRLRREPILNQTRRRLRQHHLAAMSRRHQPRRTIQRRTEVIPGPLLGRPRM
jgi:hypothetical protein